MLEGWRWSDVAQEAFAPWTADFSAYRFGGRESVGELMSTHAGVISAATLLTQGAVRLETARPMATHTIPLGRAQCLSW